MPRVSICIPAYENEVGVRRLLESVKRQTYSDYEVVLTDDSSGDSVRRAALASGIAGLRYEKNPRRLGAAANWNRAISLSGGEYVKLMHHDDWFSAPDSLEKLVALLDENPRAVIAFCGTRQVPSGNGNRQAPRQGGGRMPLEDSARQVPPKSGESQGGDAYDRCISDEGLARIRQDWRTLYLGNLIGSPSATLVRQNGLLYEEKLTWLIDMEYYMRILSQGGELACTKEPLVCIGTGPDQLTGRCAGGGALNWNEYGFLFREFSLGELPQCREKLIGVALRFGIPYGELKPFGIPSSQYRKMAVKRDCRVAAALPGIALRKLRGAVIKPEGTSKR